MARRLAVILLMALPATVAGGQELSVALSGPPFAGRPLVLEVTVPATAPAGGDGQLAIAMDGRSLATVPVVAGAQTVTVEGHTIPAGVHRVEVRLGEAVAGVELDAYAAVLSVLPPLLAILLALIFKEVLLSLFLGIFVGALCLNDFAPVTAFARVIDHYVVESLADHDHAALLIFTSLLGGMVGLITKSGGTQGIVAHLKGFATTARRGQLASWLLGVAIFFDDYANTLVVGTTMRPITDRLRISREKLAYIVDSTAAPVASLFPISTWIGYEVGLIAAAFGTIGLGFDPYGAFLASIPFRFYPIFALVLGFTLASSGRDFGPMLKAERRARGGQVLAPGDTPLADYSTEGLTPPAGVKPRALNAFLPIATVVAMTLVGLVVTGREGLVLPADAGFGTWAREVLANANSFSALLWASLLGVTVALALAIAQPAMRLSDAMAGLVEGFKSMLLALVVLILAWGLGAVCADLHTADYLVGLTAGVLSPHWFPVMVFIIAAAISFATGTSWATMAILFPLAVPIVHNLSLAAGQAPGSTLYHTWMIGVISSVLAGSVWGDHCSPISDTTILSSTASGCDHIAHVRTQTPYALAVGFLGMLVGDIPTAFGLPVWVSLLVGTTVIVVGVRWLGSDEVAG